MKKDIFLKTITTVVDPDDSPQAKAFYFRFFPEYMQSETILAPGFRGDTLISLGWTFGARNKTGSFNPSLRSYTRLFEKEEIQLFYKFRSQYHSVANFVVFPCTLNVFRGSLQNSNNKGQGTCDYPDIFLEQVRKFYLNLPITEKESQYVIPYASWLNYYGTGLSGWKSFLRKNYLLPFVNKNFEVKDLFAPPMEYKNDATKDLVGTHHGFNYALPRCSPNHTKAPLPLGKERALNFLNNALWVFESRAAWLASAEMH